MPPAPSSVLDTIIATNTTALAANGPDAFGAFTDSGSNLIGESDGSTGFGAGLTPSTLVGTSLSPIDPLLRPLGFYGGPTMTMALKAGSPAIAAGTPVSGITTDQRGVARSATPTIGAYEPGRTAMFF